MSAHCTGSGPVCGAAFKLNVIDATMASEDQRSRNKQIPCHSIHDFENPFASNLDDLAAHVWLCWPAGDTRSESGESKVTRSRSELQPSIEVLTDN